MYTVYYKKSWWLFWKKIKGVREDSTFTGMAPNAQGMMVPTVHYPVRCFTTQDGVKYEFPFLNYRFKFSKERELEQRERILAIKEMQEQAKQAKQNTPTPPAPPVPPKDIKTNRRK